MRSSKMAVLVEWGVVLLIVATLMPAARREAIWLFINARSGEMTIVIP